MIQAHIKTTRLTDIISLHCTCYAWHFFCKIQVKLKADFKSTVQETDIDMKYRKPSFLKSIDNIKVFTRFEELNRIANEKRKKTRFPC